jgi:hypothetical protein
MLEGQYKNSSRLARATDRPHMPKPTRSSTGKSMSAHTALFGRRRLVLTMSVSLRVNPVLATECNQMMSLAEQMHALSSCCNLQLPVSLLKLQRRAEAPLV